jgi:hypothetical protein
MIESDHHDQDRDIDRDRERKREREKRDGDSYVRLFLEKAFGYQDIWGSALIVSDLHALKMKMKQNSTETFDW